jgi:hypothetical protein
MNCLLFVDRAQAVGGTLYVTSAVCNACALTIATSGITRVVMVLDDADAHRDPERSIAIMSECGVAVETTRRRYGGYRRDFYEAHGLGPHTCFFCGERLPYVEIVHHVDEDRENNAPENLAASHRECHNRHHRITDAKPRGTYKRKKCEDRVLCPGCELTTTPGALGRHRKATGH